MMLLSLSISGSTVLWSIAVIALTAVLSTFLLRRNWHRRYAGSDDIPGPAPARHPKDIFRWRTTFLQIGFILSLGMVILAFAWTDYRPPEAATQVTLAELTEELLMSPPPTIPPKPAPPPIQRIETLPEPDLPEEESPEFRDLMMPPGEAIPLPAPYEEVPLARPPAPREAEPQLPEIFKVVEEMPRFPGCEDKATKEERKNCSDRALLAFISRHIRYPAPARENGIEGTVVVSFVVEVDGSITAAEVVRNPGGGLGDEALRVVQLMNEQGIRWIPGRQLHAPVRVQFNLPVRFKLQ